MIRIINDFRNRNIFNYIILLSAMIVLIITIMGAYLYRFYYSTIYGDFVMSNQTSLSAFSDRHENDMQIINDIAMQISISDLIMEFKLGEKPLKSLDLERQLYQYVSVSQFFNQILFHFHEDSYLYNHNTSVHISRLLKEGILLGDTSGDEFYHYLYDKQGGIKVLPEQKTDGYLVKQAKQYVNMDYNAVLYFLPVEPKKNSTLLFLVGNSYYDKLLDYSEEDMRKNYILHEGKVITARGTLAIDEEELLAKLADCRGSGYDRMSLGGKKYLVAFRHGKSGLLYCTVQSMDIFQQKILTNQWKTLFILLLCSVPAALAITVLSKRAFNRVRKIHALLNDEEDRDYGLENIETGIRALVENNREFTQESLPLRKSRIISKFIRNEYPDREAVVLEGLRAGLRIDRPYYIVILLGHRSNNDANEVFGIMPSQFLEEEKADGYGVNLIHNNQSLYVLFGDDTQVLEALIEKIFAAGKRVDEDTIMSVSDYHQEFDEASQAYLEAHTAFDNRFLINNSRILKYADVTNKEHTRQLPEMYLRILKNAVRSGSEEQVKQAVHEICSYLQSGQQSLLAFRLLYNDILQMLMKEWKSDDANFKYIYNVFTLSQCLTMKDFNDILCEACKLLMDSQPDRERETDLMETAIAYMQEHYGDTNLNMSFLAEYLNLSPVTLSVEFKNKTEMSPSDYLALIRIEHAKELLRRTDMKVKEISLAVGYEDDHVFMRRFKRDVGKTPAQFRKEYLDSLGG